MDYSFSEDQLKLKDKSREFAQKEIKGFESLLEEDLEFRLKLFQKMAKEGFFLLNVPRDPSSKVDSIGYALALTEIAKADAGISVAMAVTNMVAECIYKFGTESQKNDYFAKIEKGECVPLSFALTEKCAGSDAKSIKSKAELNPHAQNSFLINGEKQFITNGDISGMIIVMAKTDESLGSAGITAFLVDKGTMGLSVVKKERKLGLLAANLVSLKLNNCQVSKESILGKEGGGFSIAMSALDSGRIGIAAQAVGIAEAAFEAALKHSKERCQFGRPISENQAIAFKLADMKVKLSSAQMLLFKACWIKDQGCPYTLEASEAKLYCSEASNEIANEALQIFGGYGYVKDYPAEKYFRDARVTTLYEGTSEIQRIIIARHILKADSNCFDWQRLHSF